MKLPQLSLLPRVALGLAAVGFLPLLIASFLLIRNNFEAMILTTRNAQVVSARTAAARVDEYLQARRSLAKAVAESPALRADAQSEASKALIRGLLESLDDILGVFVVRSDGELVLGVQRVDKADKANLGRAIESGDSIAARREGKEILVRILLPIPDTDGQLIMVSDASVIAPIFVPAERIDGAEMGLFDLDGSRLEGSLDLTELPPEASQRVQENRDQSLRQGILMDGNIESEGAVAAFAGLEEAPWYVVSQEPTSVAYATSRTMVRNAGLVVGLASLLILGLSSAAYSSVVRPIRALTQSQRELMGAAKRSTGNEIEDLKAAFQLLERRVKERQALEKTFLGRYQVLDVLGEGAMGIVFRGWDPRLERPVALKTIRLDREVPDKDREHLAERLVQEAVTAARLTGPNVVAVHDVQSAGDMAFIAMELVNGHSLAEYLRMRGTLRDSEVARIGAGIARGLASAHSHGILHQDIKPANVLISDDGQIKVTDFGIANLVTALIESEDLVFGTPGYLPPEALDGEPFDEQGDLFALGVVLYQCLTGKAPFAARGLSETIRKSLDCEFTPIHEKVPDVSPELERLVHSFLAKNKNQRPGNAAEAAGLLEAMVPADGKLWKPRFTSAGPEWEDFLDARPQSRLIRSSRISDLAGTSVL